MCYYGVVAPLNTFGLAINGGSGAREIAWVCWGPTASALQHAMPFYDLCIISSSCEVGFPFLMGQLGVTRLRAKVDVKSHSNYIC